MTGENNGRFGPDQPVAPTGPPFSVTAPTSAKLDSDRRATASFVVTNTSGRDVIARLLPQPLNGADSSWLSVVGDPERPLAAEATLTAEVAIAVPPGAPAGEHAVRLDVAIEDAPDRLAQGQSVTFSVPEKRKKKFPMWILWVIIAAVVIIAGGVVAILLLRPDDPEPVSAPTLISPPTTTGEPVTNAVLGLTPGQWDPADAPLVHVWQACPADADPEAPEGCADIPANDSGDGVPASGAFLVISEDLVGMRIRVVEVALPVLSDADAEAEDLEGLLAENSASAASAMTEPVTSGESGTVVVPRVIDQTFSSASTKLAEQGLKAVRNTTAEEPVCGPKVQTQSPLAGADAQTGSEVILTLAPALPVWNCVKLEQFDDSVATAFPFDDSTLRRFADNLAPVTVDEGG